MCLTLSSLVEKTTNLCHRPHTVFLAELLTVRHPVSHCLAEPVTLSQTPDPVFSWLNQSQSHRPQTLYIFLAEPVTVSQTPDPVFLPEPLPG